MYMLVAEQKRTGKIFTSEIWNEGTLKESLDEYNDHLGGGKYSDRSKIIKARNCTILGAWEHSGLSPIHRVYPTFWEVEQLRNRKGTTVSFLVFQGNKEQFNDLYALAPVKEEYQSHWIPVLMNPDTGNILACGEVCYLGEHDPHKGVRNQNHVMRQLLQHVTVHSDSFLGKHVYDGNLIFLGLFDKSVSLKVDIPFVEGFPDNILYAEVGWILTDHTEFITPVTAVMMEEIRR